MPRRYRLALDAQPDEQTERARKVLKFMKERLSEDDYEEFTAALVTGGLSGLGRALGSMGNGRRSDGPGPADRPGESLAAMDSALRGRIARRRAEGDRLANAHAASIGITRPRVLS
jgi:hypothetical protein